MSHTIEREVDTVELHFKEDLVKKLGEKKAHQLEQAFKNDDERVESHCYAIHATNGKEVVTGPFREFVKGYLFAKEGKETCLQ